MAGERSTPHGVCEPESVAHIVRGAGPLIAAAIHDGHAVRDEVARELALPEAERLREEDPFTGRLAQVANTRVVALRSRFEVDLNRPREKAVYRRPEDAWGLEVWKRPPSESFVACSLEAYDTFYRAMESLLTEKAAQHGRFVVYDLHSYNHRRAGPDGPPADPEGNPEVNIGTGSMDRERWAPVVDRFMADLRSVDIQGRRLDVRENVKFRGGEFSTWIHRTFPLSGCAIAVEFKKVFMDEWSGEATPQVLDLLQGALARAAQGTLDVLAST